jgi:hypothetical protein
VGPSSPKIEKTVADRQGSWRQGGRIGISASGQLPSPSLATAMEELASTPDAKAYNRHASF